ncbi:MAG TPA: NYN domain-containing protein [Acidimicrobiales bacterium]|nr:NYN domain-containing protein [Acidimicrobiales bacterium]
MTSSMPFGRRLLGRAPARQVVAFVDLGFLLRSGAQVLGTSTVRYEVHMDRLVHWLADRAGALVHGHFTHVYVYESDLDASRGAERAVALQLDRDGARRRVTVRHGHGHGGGASWSRSRAVEPGAEILLAVDLIRLAHEASYDVAFLLAGEEDLAQAVRLAQGQFGRAVALVSLGGVALGPELRTSADQVITMSTHDVRQLLHTSA